METALKPTAPWQDSLSLKGNVGWEAPNTKSWCRLGDPKPCENIMTAMHGDVGQETLTLNEKPYYPPKPGGKP